MSPFKRGDVVVLLDNSNYENTADVGDVFVVVEVVVVEVEPCNGPELPELLIARRLPGPRNHDGNYCMYAHRFAKVGEVQDAV